MPEIPQSTSQQGQATRPPWPTRQLLTLSKVEIAANCQYWLRPEIPWPNDEGGYSAQLGNGLHSLAELTVKGKPYLPALEALRLKKGDSFADKVEAMYAHWKDWWAQVDMSAGKIGHAEVALAYKPTNMVARPILGRHRRDYGDVDPATEVAGTADLILESEELEVLDYKTGSVPVPPDSPQMRGLGAAAAAMFNRDRVHLRIVTIHEDGWYESKHVMEEAEIYATDSELHQLLAQTPGPPKPGPWCKWCPARDECPATKQAIADMQQQIAPGVVPGISLRIHNDQQAAKVATQLMLAQGFLESVEKALHAYTDAAGGSFDMGNGSVYSAVSVTKEYPKLTLEAQKALRGLGLGAALRVTTGWTDLTRVGGPVKAKEARELLRSLGLVGSKANKRYMARKVPKAKTKTADK